MSEEQRTSTPEEQAQAFMQAMQPMCDWLQQTVLLFSEAIEDAFRDNAYIPTGPVIRSTATVIEDEPALLPEKVKQEE